MVVINLEQEQNVIFIYILICFFLRQEIRDLFLDILLVDLESFDKRIDFVEVPGLNLNFKILVLVQITL